MTHSAEELVWEVRRLFRELAETADRVLAPLGITSSERALLEFLAKEPEPVTLSEIGRKRFVSRQHIHQTLSGLDPEWIVRSADPTDARSVALSLSAKGREFWHRVRATDRELLRLLARAASADEARAAAATLRKFRNALNPKEAASR